MPTAEQYRAALVKRSMPATGSVTCGIPEDAVVRLYGAPCHARVKSPDSAHRHLDARWRQHERDTLGDAAPKGRAARHGHAYVSPAEADIRADIRHAAGSIRADALAAAEE